MYVPERFALVIMAADDKNSWKKKFDTTTMSAEELKELGLEDARRPPGHKAGQVLHQRGRRSWRQVAIYPVIVGGLALITALSIMTVYQPYVREPYVYVRTPVNPRSPAAAAAAADAVDRKPVHPDAADDKKKTAKTADSSDVPYKKPDPNADAHYKKTGNKPD